MSTGRQFSLLSPCPGKPSHHTSHFIHASPDLTLPEPLEIALLHTLATIYMTGLIWFVQVVHYPLKAFVGSPHFSAYHEAHKNRTAWVVGPPMLIEAGSALWLTIDPPGGAGRFYPIVGLTLLALIWISTARFSIRYHNILSHGFDASSHQLLVRTNWIRTILWTIRSFLALFLLHSAHGS